MAARKSAAKPAAKGSSGKQASPPTQSLSCGLIMPISGSDIYSTEHWLEVRDILTESVDTIDEPRFHARLVSDADEIGVIQKRIVQNVYSADIVICDVSGKNANVMFELGMRLAFDKPVVIVKDDKTDYAFDTGVIEHLTYPKDLRFQRIVEFKTLLGAKLVATHRNSQGPSATSFLKNFGQFEVASLSETPVPGEQLLIESIESLRDQVRQLQTRSRIPHHGSEFSEGVRALVDALHSFPNQRRLRTTRAMPLKELESFLMKSSKAPHFFNSQADFNEGLREALRIFRARYRRESVSARAI